MALLDKLSQVLTTEITTDLIFNRKNETDSKESDYLQQLQQRQSIQKLGKNLAYDQIYLSELIHAAVLSCPSAVNMKTTRIVILFSKAHTEFWHLVQEIQKTQIPEHLFPAIAIKIQKCNAAYGTVLFFEDQTAIENLQKNSPLNSAELPLWSEQSLGMAQYAVWMALAEIGIGANFNYYSPSIDYKVAQYFKISTKWKLQTQLVFGSVEQDAEYVDATKKEAEFLVFK
ncbi:nitroreductase family protein [Acinetobacter tibetensis]|uniref:Nitroreductase family protein n=1 Tax=Acinetobacter tibetensis TaxID=2943497 RepID=A0AAE9LU67_9GAMM|nr:nitroreductase family protein [Acinetobacter tibetensis]USE84656.1 nitroreductase family protein [Acinetobacter tibetensis]